MQKTHSELEARVKERTVALSISNQLLELEITQRREWEQVLRRSEAKQRALLDALPDALVKIHRDGRVLDYKMPHSSVAPLVSGPLKGKTLGQVLPSGFAALVMDHVALALQTDRLHVFEEQLTVHDEVRDVEVRVVVGDEDEVLCILRDISERKRADRLKNEFISVVSHELRTPLTSISGSLALMAAGVTGALPAQSQAMIEIAHRNSERLVRLINDLLDLQKVESGTMPLNLQPTALLTLIDQAVEANYAYGTRFGVSFALDADAPDLWVYADTDRLMQVMTNLLSNAAKFSPEGHTVQLAVTQHGDAVRVSVADQGPGVPEDYQGRIFQKFVQADSSMTRQKEGTGLGLSISKSIIEMHGGHIGFETVPGQGSTFYFDLPEWRPPPDPDVLFEDLPADAPRVLICEDETDVACVLSGLLGQEGIRTDRAHTAAEARRLLARHDYAAVTLDMVLPDENGITLLREWGRRPDGPPVPVVVVSAEAEHARTQLQGGALWVADWLDKPVDSARLRASVKRALAQKPRGKARILHVEDDRSICVLVKMILGKVADVEQVMSLTAATACLRETHYDLIILDLNLPDGRGLDLLPVLNQRPGAPVPVVIFSSEVIDAATARQVSKVLLKTAITNEEFLRVIRALLPEDILHTA